MPAKPARLTRATNKTEAYTKTKQHTDQSTDLGKDIVSFVNTDESDQLNNSPYAFKNVLPKMGCKMGTVHGAIPCPEAERAKLVERKAVE